MWYHIKIKLFKCKFKKKKKKDSLSTNEKIYKDGNHHLIKRYTLRYNLRYIFFFKYKKKFKHLDVYTHH